MKILHARFLSSTVEGVDEIFENIETLTPLIQCKLF